MATRPEPVSPAQFEQVGAIIGAESSGEFEPNEDVVVVPADRQYSPLQLRYLGTTGAHLALAALALAAGLTSRRGALFAFPAGVALLGPLWCAANDWLAYGGEGYIFDGYLAADLLSDNISLLMTVAIIAWLFVWIGARLRRGASESEGWLTWPGI